MPLTFQLWFFFGGMMVYYMGMYGYGTDITTPDERAYRLARLDASEFLAMTIAPLISPYLFKVTYDPRPVVYIRIADFYQASLLIELKKNHS